MATPTHIKVNGVKLTLRQFAKLLVVNYGQGAYFWTERVQPDDYTDDSGNVEVPPDLYDALNNLIAEYDDKICARFGIDRLDRRVRFI